MAWLMYFNVCMFYFQVYQRGPHQHLWTCHLGVEMRKAWYCSVASSYFYSSTVIKPWEWYFCWSEKMPLCDHSMIGARFKSHTGIQNLENINHINIVQDFLYTWNSKKRLQPFQVMYKGSKLSTKDRQLKLLLFPFPLFEMSNSTLLPSSASTFTLFWTNVSLVIQPSNYLSVEVLKLNFIGLFTSSLLQVWF